MRIESILDFLFIITICLFSLRWAVKWVILNRINKTTFSPFRAGFSIDDFIPLIKHVTVSEWKVWWRGNDFKELKGYSNFLSCGLYFGTILIGLLFVLLKNERWCLTCSNIVYQPRGQSLDYNYYIGLPTHLICERSR
jgi:hypothetical protein